MTTNRRRITKRLSTVPVITSPKTASGPQGSPLSLTLTSNKPGAFWDIIGGAQETSFALNGSALSLVSTATAGTFECFISHQNPDNTQTIVDRVVFTVTASSQLAAISDLSASQIADSTAQLAWTTSVPGADRYQASVDGNDSAPRAVPLSKQLGLLVDGERAIKVRGVTDTTQAPWSNIALVTIVRDVTPPAGPGIQSRHTEEFLDSIGINMHLDWASTGDQWAPSYQWWEAVQSDLPFRRIRTGFTSGNGQSRAYINQIKTAFPTTKFDLLFGADTMTLQQISARMNEARDQIGAANIQSFDGANEVNHTWSTTNPQQDTSWHTRAMAMQQNIWEQANSRPLLANIEVMPFSIWGRSLPAIAVVEAMNSGQGASPYADSVNIHLYTGGKKPTFGGYPLASDEGGNTTQDYPFWQTMIDHKRVVPATTSPNYYVGETGYKTINTAWVASQDVHTDAVVSKYWLRMAFENFRAGIKTSYMYSLTDDAGNNNRSHGMMYLTNRTSGTWVKRPVYTAFGRVRTLLADAGVTPTLGTLNYSLSGAGLDQDIHHLLFQKRTGVFWLLIVNDATIWKTSSPFVEIAIATKNITLTLGQSVTSVNTYTPDDNTTATVKTISGTGAASNVTLPVPAKMMFVEITP